MGSDARRPRFCAEDSRGRAEWPYSAAANGQLPASRPYPEARQALAALAGRRLAILSNGGPNMLDALVRNSGLDRWIEAVISVDAARMYKPHPSCYALVERALGVAKEEALFVSSNGFDAAGAKAFGFNVVWIRRSDAGAATLYGMLRGRAEELGHPPDHVVCSLTDLPELL